MIMNNLINKDISNYYTKKILEHGNSPQGVDWNGLDGQILRFKQLSKIIKKDSPFTLLDYGCGYGAYLDYLNTYHKAFQYHGLDLSAEMIKASKKKFEDAINCSFSLSSTDLSAFDFVIASGIFNVKLHHSNVSWEKYIFNILDEMDALSVKGFACNFLSTYSDQSKQSAKLYYADPSLLFDYCKKTYSDNVILIDDYNLYEFTILVTKI